MMPSRYTHTHTHTHTYLLYRIASLCVNRVDERGDGGRLQRGARPADLRCLHHPGELDRRLGDMRLLHERRPPGVPGRVQGAGVDKQQLAARAAGEGARAEARRLRQRFAHPARHHRQLRQVTSAHGRRRADVLRHARRYEGYLQVSIYSGLFL